MDDFWKIEKKIIAQLLGTITHFEFLNSTFIGKSDYNT